MRRIEWADAARGLAILAVVWGHTSGGEDDRIIYMWHVPLFFLLSGYLYRTKGTFKGYALHRARQLLVPLACWAFLVMLPTAVGEAMKHDWHALAHRASVVAFAGNSFAGPTMGYWFLTALYLSLVAYDGLCRVAPRAIGVLCVVAYGLALFRTEFSGGRIFLWSADSILIALPYLHLGRLAREFGWAERRPLLAVGALVYLVFGAYLYTGHDISPFDIALGWNGVPGLGLALSLAGIMTVFLVMQFLGALARPFVYAGQASILILVMHGSIVVTLSRAPFHVPRPVPFALAAGVPLALFPLIRRFPASRRLLLGEDSAPQTARERAPVADESLAPDPIVEATPSV